MNSAHGKTIRAKMHNHGGSFSAELVNLGKQRHKANEYDTRGCELGYSSSCTMLGLRYLAGQKHYDELILEKDRIKAQELFESACTFATDPNAAIGCIQRGKAYIEGTLVQQDYVKALDYYRRACELDGASCKDLGELYEEGRVVPKDIILARKYYQQDCGQHLQNGYQRKESDACRAVDRLK